MPNRLAQIAALSALALSTWAGAPRAQGGATTVHAVEESGTIAPLQITFDEAVRRGLEEGPGVAAARAARPGAIDARAAASQPLAYAPRLLLEGGRRFGATSGPGVELSVGVQQDFSIAGLGRERREAAAALVDAVTTDVERARRDAGARAAQAWVDAALWREVLRLRSASLVEATRALDAARARVRVGASQPVDLALAEGDRAAAQAQVIEAEGGLVEALAELRHALGLAPDRPVEASGPLAEGDEPIDEPAAAREAEASHPAIVALASRARLARVEARLAGAQGQPSLGVGGQYRLEGTGERTYTASLVLPLPLVDPGAFERARQSSQAASAEAQVRQARALVARDVRLALHDRRHHRELRDTLARGAIVPLAEALRLAQAQLAAGVADITPVLLARQRLLGAQEQLARAEAHARRADARVAELTGTLVRPVRR